MISLESIYRKLHQVFLKEGSSSSDCINPHVSFGSNYSHNSINIYENLDNIIPTFRDSSNVNIRNFDSQNPYKSTISHSNPYPDGTENRNLSPGNNELNQESLRHGPLQHSTRRSNAAKGQYNLFTYWEKGIPILLALL